MFSYVSAEQRVPADHPLRAIRALVDDVLRDEGELWDCRLAPDSVASECETYSKVVGLAHPGVVVAERDRREVGADRRVGPAAHRHPDRLVTVERCRERGADP
jgi:hypothetical protein